ncbi:MAG: single-stranded DNA-binding protein [Pseudodesulfovibrio sp.]|uniref:single-stranded DNA-binding protein n=1 Tax=Pseudodesulfovibrio sp. TaxID=2035812 RepID=UPI003D09B6DB
MAGSLNKVIIMGRLGQDPKLSYTPGGDAVANLSVATDEGYRNRQTGQRVERTEWHRCVAWRNTAEFCGNYLSKGRLVLIEGKLQTRKWQGQDGQDRYATEIVVDRIQGLDKAPESGQGQQPGGYQNQRPTQQGQGQQYHQAPPEENLGPAFPSEASGMDDVPF